jgi:hypothetical protein
LATAPARTQAGFCQLAAEFANPELGTAASLRKSAAWEDKALSKTGIRRFPQASPDSHPTAKS